MMDEIKTQSEELTHILNSGLKDLLLAEDPENFKTIYSVALQVIRSLDYSGHHWRREPAHAGV
jgi:hypothetical protein